MAFTPRRPARARPALAVLATLVAGLGLVFVFEPASAVAQPAPTKGFHADPALNRLALAIAQGPDGRVWIGSWDGLYVYDGYTLTRFVGRAGDALEFPRGSVSSLLLDDRGRLWVGHQLGLIVVDPLEDTVDRVYRHDPSDPRSLALGSVMALHQDEAGRIWLGILNWPDEGAGGLLRLDEDESGFTAWRHDDTDPSSLTHNRVRTIVEDSNGDLWVGTWQGLNRMREDGSGFDRYRHDPADPASLSYDDVKKVHEDAAGNLWVVTIGGGLDRYDPARNAFVHVPGAGDPFLMSVVEDDSGRLWLGSLNGDVCILDPGAAELRTVDLGPAAVGVDRINALAITDDHVLWVGGETVAKGFGRTLRLDLQAPEIVVHPAGDVDAIYEGPGGEIWMSSDSRLLRWDPGADAPRAYDCPGVGPPAEDEWLGTILPAPDGTLWLGQWDADLGLCRLDPEADSVTAIAATGHGGPPLRWVSALAWMDDRLWLVARGSLLELDPSSGDVEVRRTAGVKRLPGRWALETDAAGDLWFATLTGDLARIRRGGTELEWHRGVVPHLDGTDFAEVNALRARPSGGLWIATNGFGLCEFDPAHDACTRTFGAGAGLPSDYVMDAIEGPDGRLWVATAEAITEIDLGSGAARELPLPRAVVGSRLRARSGLHTRSGALYFGTSTGAVSFRPERATGNTAAPRMRLTRVEMAGGNSADPRRLAAAGAGPLEVSGSRNDVAFEYVGIHYADPSANRYEYRLDGLDEDWRDVGAERRARFSSLAPGDYEFRVRAASANGVWSDEAVLPFRVLAPWWRQSWALALWALLAAAGLVALREVQARRRRYAMALQREQAEARRLSDLAATRSRLFANLSHEYRTPLSLILGQIESARADAATASGDDGARKLEMAGRQTRELQRLTDQLLELSRLESGALELNWRDGDLSAVARSCVAAFHSAAAAGGIELRLEAPDAPIEVRYDADRLRRVINNLIANALKFTPEGGGVVVRLQVKDGQAVLSVSDTGSGIPADARDRIFDRFYRVPTLSGDASGVPGTGIGLALVRELVELHGGTITVESEVGVGSDFEVRLPLLSTQVDAAESASPAGGTDGDDGDLAGEADESAAGPPIILVVDDHADMRAFLRQELSAYRVEEAADGVEGRARALDLIPDLIITDLVMPEMDGYDLVRGLREDERTSHVPIIMLTGRSSDDARIAGLETGVDDYLPKPFNARVLRSRVENLLELRRMLRARFAGEVLLKPEEVAATSLDQKFLERVSRTIEERMSDNSFTVEELASAVAMSRSQLHRKLTALLDQSPGALIRGMRLQRAADLIRSGSRTLSQIAFDVGFSDQAHFIRAFRRQYDCTPSEYRDREPE